MSQLSQQHGDSQKKKIVVTGGGTGGHVFPALAVIEQLQNRYDITWIGSRNGMESDIVGAWGIRFVGVHAGKLRRYASLRNATDFFCFLLGIIESLCLLARIRPSIVFSKGGYASLAPVIASGILKIPVLAQESDYDPGLATRIGLKFTAIQCIAYEESRKFYSSQALFVSGNPIRQGIFAGKKERAVQNYGLRKDMPVLLVLGGSLGSQQINDLMKNILPQILPTVQVIHQTGNANFGIEMQASLEAKGQIDDRAIVDANGRPDEQAIVEANERPDEQSGERGQTYLQAGERAGGKGRQSYRYVHKAFFSEDYADVLAAADLVLARSGAGLLWEIGALRKPAVFIPLVSGSRGDQIRNAQYAERHDASITVSKKSEFENLGENILGLLQDKERLRSMSQAWGSVVHGNAARNIAQVIENILNFGVESVQESLRAKNKGKI